jgi:DNA-binding NarL/FixJ family response regulator
MTPLSPREEMVLRLMWEGMEYKQIAMALDLSAKTVEYARVGLGRKLGATNGLQVIRRALEQGLIQVGTINP